MPVSLIQPWGTAPTPLLPAALMQVLGHLPAPSFLTRYLKLATLSDVDHKLWTRVSTVSEECLAEIVAIAEPHLKSWSHLPVRSGRPS